MPTKIRLQRHGKKGSAYFHIVIADGRAPRDGKFIEKIGSYNPNTNPATIELNNQKALTWLKNGAQPTETARAILSYKGVLFKHHLDKGVAKGALTEEQAQAKYEDWLNQKQNKIEGKVTRLASSRAELLKKRHEDEKEKNAKRASSIALKNTPEIPQAEESTDAVADEITAEPTIAAEETTAEPTASSEEESKQAESPAEGE